MKRLMTFFLSSCLLLSACSKRQDSIASDTADLHFSKDTVFVRVKDFTNINNSGNGMFTVFASPALHQLNMQYSEPTGKVHFSCRGAWLTDSQPFVVAADSSGLFCAVDTPGVYTVDFYLTDQLGRVVNKQLIVKCAPSSKPIADLQYVQVSASADNWLYYFNAAGSRQPYGAIVSYNYLINGVAMSVNRPLLKWVFHSAGEQDASFYVIDDLGTSSDTLHYSIQVP